MIDTDMSGCPTSGPQTPLEAARLYASYGLRVMPIKPGTKAPHFKAWQEVATTDEAIIDSWWGGLYRDHGVGIATGRTADGSTLVVLDIDVSDGKQGAESLAALEAQYGLLPTTVSARTGSGGLHLYYLVPPGYEIRNNQSGKLGPGIDIRGEGGQVVAAPTVHPNGQRYAWVPGRGLGELPIAVLPAVVADIACAPLGAREGHREAKAWHPEALPATGDRPGDIFNARTDWETLLAPDGWQIHSRGPGQAINLTRPGKPVSEGMSATLGYQGSDNLYCFSTSVPFLEVERPYDRWGYYVARDYGGDFIRAAREYRAQLDDEAPDWEAAWLADVPVQASPVPSVGLGTSEGHVDGPAVSEPPVVRFRPAGMAELMELGAQPLRWLIKGVLTEDTFGQLAGEMKSLKSHTATALTVGLAAGVPVMGHWDVPQRTRVLTYLGEGGQRGYARRLIRHAKAHGVDPRQLDGWVYSTPDVAAMGTREFTEALRRNLGEIQPGLFILDPLYAYHGGAVDSRNVHAEGEHLSSLQNLCAQHGAVLLIVNHLNKTGTGTGLSRITQAGSGEWVDSWLLSSKRPGSNVGEGKFCLQIDIGSRQWGGSSWDIDVNLGRFDPETGDHSGQITYNVRPHRDDDGGPTPEDRKDSDIALEILRVYRQARKTWLTRADIRERVGRETQRTSKVIARMVDDGRLLVEQRPYINSGGNERRRDEYRLADGLSAASWPG